jgi:hypothetical protein
MNDRDLEETLRRYLASETEHLPVLTTGPRILARIERSASRRWARVLSLAAMTATAVGVVGLLLLWDGMAGRLAPGEGSPAAGSWGPLAVIRTGGGDFALTTGTVEIGDKCVYVRNAAGSRQLLIWHAKQTTWDADQETISVTDRAGNTFVLRDGDTVILSGGGDSVQESGVSSAAWVSQQDWVARPHASCEIDAWWGVDGVAVPR